MPSWNEIFNEIHVTGSPHDVVRRKYLAQMHEATGRNVIAYYSGWLQKEGVPGMSITDEDKNGFMAVIDGMDTSIGLDLVIHTPGGDAAATESLVDYIRSVFGTDIRAIVPQIAMSAGTMIACACKEILMGKQSSLGPIDPQLGGIAAHGVVEEFTRAKREVQQDSSSIPIWQAIIANYRPTLIGDCEKAIAWSNELTAEWLRSGMFDQDSDADAKIGALLQELGDHALTKSHSRHLSFDRCREMGLKVSALEESGFQDEVLSLHHAYVQTFAATPAVKIIENQNGTPFIKAMR